MILIFNIKSTFGIKKQIQNLKKIFYVTCIITLYVIYKNLLRNLNYYLFTSLKLLFSTPLYYNFHCQYTYMLSYFIYYYLYIRNLYYYLNTTHIISMSKITISISHLYFYSLHHL